MIRGIGRLTVLVEDQGAALAFYRDLLGLTVTYDEVVDGLRYVQVGVPGQEPVALWLVPPTTNDSRSVRGHQAGDAPMLVLYTDDLDDVIAGLRFAKKDLWGLVEGATSRSVHTRDPDGNVVVIAELTT